MPETVAVAPAALVVRGLTYSYPRAPAPALEDVWLELEPGTFTVLAGGSGSGKSTLLRAACGLVPHFHGGEFGGDVLTCGMSVRDSGPNELAQACGTLLQEPESQVVMGGVRAEIALALEHRGASPQSVARAVEEAALALGIGNLLDRRTQSLSGGELQRVALAAAISHRPDLLLLDEPTSQLDPVAGEELIWLLRRLNEEWGTTVVVAEHRLERSLPAADRVVAMEAGRVTFDGTPDAFLDWAVGEAPEHATPLARMFALAGLSSFPVQVKEARATLAHVGREGESVRRPPRAQRVFEPTTPPAPRRHRRRSRAAAELRGVWHELVDGPAILRGIDLALEPGEVVALMGRNGAGKSTLLRHLKGLVKPTRGRVGTAGEVALLLQQPGDYLVREHVGEEVGPGALERARLGGRGDANPRDLSGGERQRLALEVALGEREWACVCLDEPTRGIDRAARDALAARVRELASAGAAVVIATHDVELAAELADRVVLMGAGEIVADGSPAEVLAGGWHFATDVARALGAEAGALTPEEGAAALAAEGLDR